MASLIRSPFIDVVDEVRPMHVSRIRTPTAMSPASFPNENAKPANAAKCFMTRHMTKGTFLSVQENGAFVARTKTYGRTVYKPSKLRNEVMLEREEDDLSADLGAAVSVGLGGLSEGLTGRFLSSRSMSLSTTTTRSATDDSDAESLASTDADSVKTAHSTGSVPTGSGRGSGASDAAKAMAALKLLKTEAVEETVASPLPVHIRLLAARQQSTAFDSTDCSPKAVTPAASVAGSVDSDSSASISPEKDYAGSPVVFPRHLADDTTTRAASPLLPSRLFGGRRA